MKKLAPIVVISVFIIALNACRTDKGTGDPVKESKDEAIEQKDWKTLEKPEYSIQYPESWTLENSGADGTMFTITSTLVSNKDSITENIDMKIDNLPEEVTLEEFAQDAITTIESSIFTILTKERVKSDKDDYYKLIFSGDKDGVGVKIEQHYRVKNNKAYVIGFMSSKVDFDKDKVVAQRILNKFKLK